MIEKHKVMREKNNSAESNGCSKFKAGASKLRIKLPWSNQGPDRCVCFRNQSGIKNPASPGGHVRQASMPVFKTGFFFFSNTDSKQKGT